MTLGYAAVPPLLVPRLGRQWDQAWEVQALPLSPSEYLHWDLHVPEMLKELERQVSVGERDFGGKKDTQELSAAAAWCLVEEVEEAHML